MFCRQLPCSGRLPAALFITYEVYCSIPHIAHPITAACAVAPPSNVGQVGEHAGIGCMIDSCGKCEQCAASEEQ